MVTFHLNGRQVEAEAGTPVLLAAMAHGVFIPHLCYHPALTAVGRCRLCLARVEVDGESRLTTTCNLPVREGMQVTTVGPEIDAARESALEFILARHPLECPTCERAGECELQAYAAVHGRDRGCRGPGLASAALAPAAADLARQSLGPHVEYEPARCIGCGRCVRFEEEIAGTRRLATAGMGAAARPALVGSEPLAHPLSGNLPELCPAGALVDPHATADPPPWRLRGVDTVCPGCASACPVRVDTLDGRIYRVAARRAHPPWLCDEGRFGWRESGGQDRLVEPQIRADGVLRPAPWDAALDAAVSALQQTGRAVWVSDGWETVEEGYLRGLLARHLGAATHCLRTRRAVAGELEFPGGFTVSADRSPNRRGLEELGRHQKIQFLSPDVLWTSLESGRVRALCWLGGDANRDLGPRQVAALANVERLVAVERAPSALTGLAHVVLPGAGPYEGEGTVIGRDGMPRQLCAAIPPPGQARPVWQILLDLARAARAPWCDALTDPAAVRRAVAAELASVSEELRPSGLSRLGEDECQSRPGQSQPGQWGSDTSCGGGWTAYLQRRGFLAIGQQPRRADRDGGHYRHEC